MILNDKQLDNMDELSQLQEEAVQALKVYLTSVKQFVEDKLKSFNLDKTVCDIATGNKGTLSLRFSKFVRVSPSYVSNPFTLIFKTQISGVDEEFEVGSFGRNEKDWTKFLEQVNRRFHSVN